MPFGMEMVFKQKQPQNARFPMGKIELDIVTDLKLEQLRNAKSRMMAS